jgi:DNA-binding NtrC family response regulator
VNMEFTILIADKNRHVREFLKREMLAEGYQVRLAKSGREVLKCAYYNEPLDLLILDPDLSDASEIDIMDKLQNRIPTLPVVIHAYRSDYANCHSLLSTAAFVEKNGSSIEGLKKAVSEIFRKCKRQQPQNSIWEADGHEG